MDYPQFDGSVAFERHRRRRAQGVPTVTVLVGELEVAERCWTAWHRTARYAPVSVAGTAGLEPILSAWLEAPVVRAAFVSELVQHAARAHGVSCDELRVRIAAHSEGQRERWAEQLSRSLGWSRTLIEAALETRAALLSERVRAGFPRVLAELEGLLPFGLPALWIECSGEATPELHTTIAPLLQIAEAVPRAELAFAATEVELERWQRSAPERDVMLLRAGMVRLEPLANLRPPNAEARGTERERHAPSPALVGRVETAAPAGVETAELARSRAERELYDRLEARPLTRGIFALNVELEACFGARPLEVDLLCEELRLALEVDGYHHFRDASAYRRDREKDVLLQRLGYTVVRVLASDVEDELAYVIDKIDRIVDQRRREKQ